MHATESHSHPKFTSKQRQMEHQKPHVQWPFRIFHVGLEGKMGFSQSYTLTPPEGATTCSFCFMLRLELTSSETSSETPTHLGTWKPNGQFLFKEKTRDPKCFTCTPRRGSNPDPSHQSKPPGPPVERLEQGCQLFLAVVYFSFSASAFLVESLESLHAHRLIGSWLKAM